MEYELIAEKLRDNHFYPSTERTGEKITGLRVECGSIILMEDKKKRLEEILGEGVKVTCFKNHGYLFIKKINKREKA